MQSKQPSQMCYLTYLMRFLTVYYKSTAFSTTMQIMACKVPKDGFMTYVLFNGRTFQEKIYSGEFYEVLYQTLEFLVVTYIADIKCQGDC